MILAEDLATPGGRFLMPKGTRLGKSHLMSLAGWGVTEVDVVMEAGASRASAASGVSGSLGPSGATGPAGGTGPSGAPGSSGPAGAAATPPGRSEARDASASARPEDFLEEAKRITWERFRHVDLNQEVAGVLFKLCVARLAKRMAKNSASGCDPLPPPAVPAREPVAHEGPIPAPEDVLREDPQLVSLPEVFVRINEVLKNPNKSMDEAADVISMDPSLSAKLLKLVNSAFYARAMRAVQQRFPTKVDSLTRAVMIVGGKQLNTLALGISVLPIFQDIPREYIDMKSFWMHSIACGVFARGLAARSNPEIQESAFVAGLLHDIGRLIMYKHVSALSGQALALARKENILLVEAERRILSWDHARMGGLLLRKWQYPEALEQAALRHHDPEGAPFALETAIIHVADVIANALEIGASGERLVPALSPAAFAVLGIQPAELKTVISEVGNQISEIFRWFFPQETETA